MPAPPTHSGRPALAQLSALHDRLPIPLAAGTIDAWLDPRDEDGLAMLDLVRGEATTSLPTGRCARSSLSRTRTAGSAWKT